MWWVGLVVASLYSLACLGRTSGSEPRVALTVPGWVYRGMCIVSIDSKDACHAHHWLLLLPAWFLPLPPACHWFVAGMILQGLSYRDRFECIKSNPHNPRLAASCAEAPCSEVVCRV